MATPHTTTGNHATAPDAAQTSLRLHEALRQAGLRPTFHRLYVMRVLDQAAPGRLTAEQVFQQLYGQAIAVSQATVYRALSDLEQHGLLRRTRLQDGSDNKVRYAMTMPSAPAPSCTFSCQVCKEEIVVTDPAFCDQLQRQAEASGFDRLLATMRIAITCNRCV